MNAIKIMQLCLCEYCIQAIKAHGDKVAILDTTDNVTKCDFCEEEDATYYCIIK